MLRFIWNWNKASTRTCRSTHTLQYVDTPTKRIMQGRAQKRTREHTHTHAFWIGQGWRVLSSSWWAKQHFPVSMLWLSRADWNSCVETASSLNLRNYRYHRPTAHKAFRHCRLLRPFNLHSEMSLSPHSQPRFPHEHAAAAAAAGETCGSVQTERQTKMWRACNGDEDRECGLREIEE